jgi:hypothetical protein
MVRFSVKSLLLLTMLVAAYITVGVLARHDPTPAGVSAVVVYLGLMFWAISRSEND